MRLFVKDLARSLKIEFHTGMMTLTDKNKVNEAVAREARFKFFKDEMNKFDGRALFFRPCKRRYY